MANATWSGWLPPNQNYAVSFFNWPKPTEIDAVIELLTLAKSLIKQESKEGSWEMRWQESVEPETPAG